VLAEYLPSLLFLLVATGIGIALLVIGNVLGPKRPTLAKLSPYECGFEAFEDARMKFDVRYYLIAIRDLGVLGLIEMGIFAGMLLLGFIYVWKRGALEWE